MNYRQLTFAREFRGLNQSDLSASIKGLSQPNLSKFEKGLGVLSEDVQSRIIQFLEFPAAFFDKKINSEIESAHYRKKAQVSKTDIVQFENRCKLFGYIVDEMSASLEWPTFDLTPLNVDEGFTPEYIASYTRAALGLKKDQPVRDICTLLENRGVIIYEMNANEKFDGISFMTDKGYPIIVINKNFPNCRKRFTIAHELGHLLIHNDANFPISPYRDEKTKEKEANIFASEFLMPASGIQNMLRGIKFSDLGDLKTYWHTSMASILRRAKDLGSITEDRYKFFMIEMSRYGFNKKEPIQVYIDKPQCFQNGYNLYTKELQYTDNDFSDTFALPIDVIEEMLYFGRPILKIMRN